jgi:ABC-type transporter Mla subunit MlaD
MSSSCSLDPAIASVLAAKEQATRSQIQFAVAAKQQDAAQQQGDAMNQLLAQAAQLSKSLSSGQGFDAVG